MSDRKDYYCTQEGLEMSQKDIRVWVRKGLIAQVKEAYHETQGMKASGLVDWALRYVILLERKLPREKEEVKLSVEE
jgi:hypothetical protein